jgi:hypothetical protein
MIRALWPVTAGSMTPDGSIIGAVAGEGCLVELLRTSPNSAMMQPPEPSQLPFAEPKASWISCFNLAERGDSKIPEKVDDRKNE